MWSSCDQWVQVWKDCDNLCQACAKLVQRQAKMTNQEWWPWSQRKEYIKKFDSNDKKKFCEVAKKKKEIGVRKGWWKVLTKDQVMDQKSVDDMADEEQVASSDEWSCVSSSHQCHVQTRHFIMSRPQQHKTRMRIEMPGRCGKSYVVSTRSCRRMTWLRLLATTEFNACKMKKWQAKILVAIYSVVSRTGAYYPPQSENEEGREGQGRRWMLKW